MSAESIAGAAPQPVRRTVDVVLAVTVVAALLLTSFAVVLGEYLRDCTGSEFYLVIPLVVFFASPVALIVFCVRLVIFWRRLQTWGRLTRLVFPFVVILGCVLAQSQGLFHRLDKAVHSWVRPQATDVDFLDLARLAVEIGGDSEQAAVGHDILALPLMFENRADAEAHLRKSLDIRERLYGPNHPRVAFSLRNLARVLSMEGKHEVAQARLKQALEAYGKAEGPQDKDQVECLADLADCYCDQKRYAEAVPLFQAALAICERHDGPDTEMVASLLERKAAALRGLGREEEAKGPEARAKAIRQTQQRGAEKP